MKVIVDDQVYDSETHRIGVFLSDKDKFNIMHMAPGARVHAEYDGDTISREEIDIWITRMRALAEGWEVKHFPGE